METCNIGSKFVCLHLLVMWVLEKVLNICQLQVSSLWNTIIKPIPLVLRVVMMGKWAEQLLLHSKHPITGSNFTVTPIRLGPGPNSSPGIREMCGLGQVAKALKNYLFLILLCICVSAGAHRVHIRVRGQFSGAASPLPPCGIRGSNSGCKPVWKHIYLLSISPVHC